MSDVLGKIAEYLLNKHWAIFLLSVALGFGGYFLLPSEFVDKMPFDSRDWNVAACMILLSIAAYLILSLLRFLYSKMRAGARKRKNERYYAEQDQRVAESRIEKIRSNIDEWTDRDYSVLMFLMEKENKEPYIEFGFRGGESALDYSEWFNRAPYNGTKTTVLHTPDGDRVAQSIGPGRQYLLKPEMYEILQYILKEKGSLSHFPRQRVNID